MDINQLEKEWQKVAKDQLQAVDTQMWDQLNDRLDKAESKPVVKMRSWMWVAASFLVLVTAFSIHKQDQKAKFHSDTLAYNAESDIIATEDLALVTDDFYKISQVMILHDAYQKLEDNSIK